MVAALASLLAHELTHAAILSISWRQYDSQTQCRQLMLPERGIMLHRHVNKYRSWLNEAAAQLDGASPDLGCPWDSPNALRPSKRLLLHRQWWQVTTI